MRRLGNELLLPRVNLTFRLVAFELLALLIIQKLRAWAIAILSFLEKVSVFSFASLKLCMVTLLRYGYLVDNS